MTSAAVDPVLSHRDHGVGDLVEVVQVLVPERMTNSLFGEQPAAAGLRPEVHESWVGTVHRDPERHGEVTLELRRVVRDEVAQRSVRDQRRRSGGGAGAVRAASD